MSTTCHTVSTAVVKSCGNERYPLHVWNDNNHHFQTHTYTIHIVPTSWQTLSTKWAHNWELLLNICLYIYRESDIILYIMSSLAFNGQIVTLNSNLFANHDYFSMEYSLQNRLLRIIWIQIYSSCFIFLFSLSLSLQLKIAASK